MTDQWLPVALVFLAGGLVKGAVGLGLPTVVLVGLAAYMPVSKAAAILVVPLLVTNAWQLFGRRGLGQCTNRLAGVLVGLVCATLLSPVAIASVNTRTTTLWLGALLASYAVIGLANVHLSVSPAAERWLSWVLGILSGVVNAATGLFVMPLVPYLQSLDMDKDELVQALALCFTVGALAFAARLWMDGTSVMGDLKGSAVAVVAALAGMPIGKALRDRSNQQVFRMSFFVALLGAGATLVGKVVLT